MQVHARFRLSSVTRAQGWYKELGSTEIPQVVESASVRLSAIQGEPFGAYTPNGNLDMLIANPSASQVFFDASIGQEFDVFLSPVEAE